MRSGLGAQIQPRISDPAFELRSAMGAETHPWSPHPALDRCSTGGQIKAGSSDWTHICLAAQIQDGSSDRTHILPKASFTSAKQSRHFSTKPRYSLIQEGPLQQSHHAAGAQGNTSSHITYHVLWDHVLCTMSYVLYTMYCVLSIMYYVSPSTPSKNQYGYPSVPHTHPNQDKCSGISTLT